MVETQNISSTYMQLIQAIKSDKGLENDKQLADAIGVHPEVIYRLQKGAKQIRFDVLLLLKQYSGYSWKRLGDLIHEEFGA
ncbi:MAG: hypothetical protein KDH96_09105 [Candidatus Riesia sp.]|nr:hypothetical protein [Candidatus Riesia sp.]